LVPFLNGDKLQIDQNFLINTEESFKKGSKIHQKLSKFDIHKFVN